MTKDEFIPESWEAKRDIARKYERSVRDIRKRVGIGLIVHTRKICELLENTGSSFSKDILVKGRRLT